MGIKFLDTNVLLDNPEQYFDEEFYISSVTLRELENIKSQRTKDESVRYAARKAVRLLNEHIGGYHVLIYDGKIKDILSDYQLDDSPDNRICASAYFCKTTGKDIVFITNDLCCRIIAEGIFNLDVKWHVKAQDNFDYTGFKEISMNEEEMAYFYEHQSENMYGLLNNQYLIIKNLSGDVIESYRWDGKEY